VLNLPADYPFEAFRASNLVKAGVMSLNEKEFGERVSRMRYKLYCVAYSILWNDADCADAMQEAAAKAWMHRFRLEAGEYFETWFMRILINECRMLKRKRRRIGTAPDQDIPAPERDAAADIDLRNAFRRLPEKYQLLLILRYQDGYSVREISGMLSLREELVKSRLRQARAELRRLLGGDGYEV
jgi:RNA polymerase sigma-70 factor (ECF subfamily)